MLGRHTFKVLVGRYNIKIHVRRIFGDVDHGLKIRTHPPIEQHTPVCATLHDRNNTQERVELFASNPNCVHRAQVQFW